MYILMIGFVCGFIFSASIWSSNNSQQVDSCTAQNNAILSCDRHLLTCLSWQARVLMELERIEVAVSQ